MGILVSLVLFVFIWWILCKVFTPGFFTSFIRRRAPDIPEAERKRKLKIREDKQ